MINSTGSREGLQLILNLDQSNYVGSFGHIYGVKVAVHPQSESPQVDKRGILVGPGASASISFRKHMTNDLTRRNCDDTPYATCVQERFYERLRNKCNCFSNVYDQDSADESLNICPFSEMCCYLWRYYDALETPCLPACMSTEYDITSTSYAQWPTEYLPNVLNSLLGSNTLNITYLRQNWMHIDIFYSSLNVQTQTTAYTYGFEEFFAEVGGQLGLFIGISVISLFEILIYIFDEIKDRCCKPLCCRKRREKPITVI